MKNFITVLIVLFSMINTSILLGNSVKFENGTWNEIKDIATKSNKIIFLDAYTDWCGWCKVMDKETFTNDDVIEFLKNNFISVKYEMESGIGKTLAMKYRVRGFPTQLFFTPDGKLIYESAGYQPPKQFIETLKLALNKDNHFKLSGISDKIDLDFPDFYKFAFAKNGSEEKRYPTPEEVVGFLEKSSDLFDEVNWSVLSQFQSNQKFDDFFLNNIEKYKNLYGNSSVNQKLYSIIYNKFSEAVKSADENLFNQNVIAMIDKYDNSRSNQNKSYYTNMFYEKTNNWSKLSENIQSKIDKNELTDENINEYCWNLYEKCNDEGILKKAVLWIKLVIEKSPNYMNLDTYAALLYKTKDFKNAKIFAEKAIEYGNKSGENVKSTEKLLEMINELNNQ